VKVLVMNGPNLNLLGMREPGVYGSASLGDVEGDLRALAGDLGVDIDFYQSNHEGALVDRIQQARADRVDFVIINAGAFTHTSVAIRDALSGVSIPFVEVHISNVHKRDAFRRHSYLSDIAEGVIVGLGVQGYELALRYVHRRLGSRAAG
jgi:3-dehydroquinate dehydratase-2